MYFASVSFVVQSFLMYFGCTCTRHHVKERDQELDKGNTERQVFTQDLRSSNFIPPSSMNVEFNAKGMYNLYHMIRIGFLSTKFDYFCYRSTRKQRVALDMHIKHSEFKCRSLPLIIGLSFWTWPIHVSPLPIAFLK
ncbi:uncharacterized protein LOC111367099 isoform X2 [Olea europaea var. sylvestris]|uniref:uncharacterized protein LOC111367099 isoform X2 n=1 Tax=Olea europaea var. sylvestris TaxID=158386 RepID=UPI000C1D0B1F|nr:uncharacterized protein LOC111367099 isoform X2 [Olea europaea var. sylvestris]